MAELTQQEMFDRVAVHLLKQGTASVDRYGKCSYRGTAGRMCAIGVLIGDDEYSPGMEGLYVSELFGVGAIGPGNLDLADDLQRLHDSVSPDEWGHELAEVANCFGLDASVLEVPSDG